MRALCKTAAAPGFELADRPPVAGPVGVVIRVLRTGICGTGKIILDWTEL